MVSKTDIIESLLFASDKPVTLKKLAQIVELTPDETMAELDALRVEKESIGSIQLIEVAGGWQLATKPQFSQFIRQLRDAPRQRLSRAAFEVLAVVAYRQPVTRSEIEALRGVDCSGPVQFLLEKKLLEFAGRKDAPGRPHLYGTTAEFLDHFGLRDLSDLPTLEELAELNGGALALGEIHDGDSLFNRGAMKTEEDAEAEADEAEAAARAAAAEAAEEAAENAPAEVEPGETPEAEDTVPSLTDEAASGAIASDETSEGQPAPKTDAAPDVKDTATPEIEAPSSPAQEAEPIEPPSAYDIAEGEPIVEEATEELAQEAPAIEGAALVEDEEIGERVVLPPDMWAEDEKVPA
jgi:segregation and condensation protein B